MSFVLRSAPLADLSPAVLYRLLQLRVRVFVVEQKAAYDELDGRDLEPGTLQLWAEQDDEVVGTLRILTDTDCFHIGRVVTAPVARGRGVGGEMLRRAIAHCTARDPRRPILIDAQAHLAHWYARFGFTVRGAEFAWDGIAHLPMRREAAERADG